MKKITKISGNTHISQHKKKTRVAAYCRVSTGMDAQLESLAAQRSHYEHYIKAQPNWELAGVYYDEGISGTKKSGRAELLHLMEDCRAGKVDLVITKSISRFARNTADCLELVRTLQALDIPVYFESEKINTLSTESELFLAVLSSMAEGESKSISGNARWSLQKRFENGTYKICRPPYGYSWDGERIFPDPCEAPVVQEIFAAYLSGKGAYSIAKELNRRGVPTRKDSRWTDTTIRDILRNEKYVGDCLLQKTYTDSGFTRHHNHGEENQYMVHDHHEPLISREDFDAVQELRGKRASGAGADKYHVRYAFSGKIVCGECGGTFKRRSYGSGDAKYVSWCCKNHLQDAKACSIQDVRDEALKLAFVTMMNKLIFSRNVLLKPYVAVLKTASTDQTLCRIQQLRTELDRNNEKQGTLMGLLGRKVIDPVLYTREMNSLLARADSQRREITTLKSTVTEDVEKANAADDLLRYVIKAEMLSGFDDALFERFVNRIVIHSRTEAVFELKCGLQLKEVLS